MCQKSKSFVLHAFLFKGIIGKIRPLKTPTLQSARKPTGEVCDIFALCPPVFRHASCTLALGQDSKAPAPAQVTGVLVWFSFGLSWLGNFP